MKEKTQVNTKGYKLVAKQCKPCRGTGTTSVTKPLIACIHCLGYGQVLYAVRSK